MLIVSMESPSGEIIRVVGSNANSDVFEEAARLGATEIKAVIIKPDSSKGRDAGRRPENHTYSAKEANCYGGL